jgi:predicted esterase
LDYVNYLDALCESLSGNAKNITILGFSQGAATAVRWACQGKMKPSQLILWAGSFPTDMDLPQAREQLTDTNLILAVGNKDEFISTPAIKNVKGLLDEADIPYTFHEFDGTHDIQRELFLSLVEL